MELENFEGNFFFSFFFAASKKNFFTLHSLHSLHAVFQGCAGGEQPAPLLIWKVKMVS